MDRVSDLRLRVDLTDEQWDAISGCFPAKERKRTTKKGGRPWRDPRDVVNGVLWILRTGAPWAGPAGPISAVPNVSPTVSNVGRRRSVRACASSTRRGSARSRQTRPDRGVHRWLPRGGKKGGPLVGNTRRGKATKVMAVADRSGLPIAVGIESGQRNEQKLVVGTLKRSFLRKALPKILIGDKAYDSDPLDRELAAMGIEMISPHHPRRRRKTRDARKLRRYKRRWSSDSSPGSFASGAWSLATKRSPRTSSDLCSSPAPRSSGGSYETRSSRSRSSDDRYRVT